MAAFAHLTLIKILVRRFINFMNEYYWRSLMSLIRISEEERSFLQQPNSVVLSRKNHIMSLWLDNRKHFVTGEMTVTITMFCNVLQINNLQEFSAVQFCSILCFFHLSYKDAKISKELLHATIIKLFKSFVEVGWAIVNVVLQQHSMLLKRSLILSESVICQLQRMN